MAFAPKKPISDAKTTTVKKKTVVTKIIKKTPTKSESDKPGESATKLPSIVREPVTPSLLPNTSPIKTKLEPIKETPTKINEGKTEVKTPKTSTSVVNNSTPLSFASTVTSPSSVNTNLDMLASSKYLLCWHNAQQGQLHPIKRQGHTCVPYQQSMILYGGYSGQPVGDMWFLDTTKMRWSRFEAASIKPGKRTGHTAVVIKDKMYMFGGETGLKCTNDLWVFDIPLKTWTQVEFSESEKVPAARCGHAAIAYGTTMVIFGGADRFSQMFNDVWLFDSLTQRWTEVDTHTDVPQKRHGHTLTLVGETIFLFGGYGSGGRLNDTWKLDPVLLNWTPIDTTGSKPTRRSHHSAVGLRNKMIIFGGLGSTSAQDLWQLDIYSHQWSRLELSKYPKRVNISSNLVGPSARYGHTACVFRGIRMFVFGGVGDGNAYREDLWYLYIDPSIETAPTDVSADYETDVDDIINSLENSMDLDTSMDKSMGGKLEAALDEQQKLWKLAHERIIKDVETLKSSLLEDKLALKEVEEAQEEKWHQNTAEHQEHDKRILVLEKNWKKIRKAENSLLNVERIENLTKSYQEFKTAHEKQATEIEKSSQDIEELFSKISGLEEQLGGDFAKNYKAELKRQKNKEEDTEVAIYDLKEETTALQSQVDELKKVAIDNSDKARVHYKKLKYKTEIAMKQYRKDFDTKVNTILQQTQDFTQDIEEKQAEVVRLTKLYGEKLSKFETSATTKEHVQQEVSVLEKRIQEQRDEYLAYKAKREQEEADFQKKFQEVFENAIEETKQQLSNDIKKVDKNLRNELRENTAVFNLEMKETEERMEAKVSQLEQSMEEKNEAVTSTISSVQEQLESLRDKVSIGMEDINDRFIETSEQYEDKLSAAQDTMASKLAQYNKDLMSLIEAQAEKLREEREMREKLEQKIEETKKLLEEKLGDATESVKKQVEETVTENLQPRIFYLEQQLAVVNDNLVTLENDLKDDFNNKLEKKEEAEAVQRQEFRETIEGRLQLIKREITKLLLAVNGKMDEEENQVDSFTKKIQATMDAANNLQFVLAKIREE